MGEAIQCYLLMCFLYFFAGNIRFLPIFSAALRSCAGSRDVAEHWQMPEVLLEMAPGFWAKSTKGARREI